MNAFIIIVFALLVIVFADIVVVAHLFSLLLLSFGICLLLFVATPGLGANCVDMAPTRPIHVRIAVLRPPKFRLMCRFSDDSL